MWSPTVSFTAGPLHATGAGDSRGTRCPVRADRSGSPAQPVEPRGHGRCARRGARRSHIAVFDTAFHATLSPEAFIYPLPAEWSMEPSSWAAPDAHRHAQMLS